MGDRPRRIVLVGLPGSGKTKVGRLLAARLGWPFRDADEVIVEGAGMPVAEIFREEGEAAFRSREERTIESLLEVDREAAVVSVGGGAVVSARNRSTLRAGGTVVWLRPPFATLARRVGDGKGRPLLGGDPEGALRRLCDEREPLYAEVADVVVDVVDGDRPEDALDRVEDALRTSGLWPA